MNGFCSFYFFQFCSFSTFSDVSFSQCRGFYDAENGLVIFPEGDGDRKEGVGIDIVSGAIQRIDDPEFIRSFIDHSRFFGEVRVGREVGFEFSFDDFISDVVEHGLHFFGCSTGNGG